MSNSLGIRCFFKRITELDTQNWAVVLSVGWCEKLTRYVISSSGLKFLNTHRRSVLFPYPRHLTYAGTESEKLSGYIVINPYYRKIQTVVRSIL